MYRSLSLLLLLSFLVGVAFSTAGCSKGPSKPQPTATVKGTVTWQGKPIELGDISFRMEQQKDDPISTQILKGSYQVKLLTGPGTVEIQAFRPGEEGTSGDPVIPPDTLGRVRKIEIKDGDQTLDFQIAP